MACGLRQGCILSLLLFSLYINSLVTKLKEAEVGVKCREQLISVLLYANDAVIFAEDEKLMRRGLDVLAEWCGEWLVEVNVEKCGVMHMRSEIAIEGYSMAESKSILERESKGEIKVGNDREVNGW